MMNPETKHFEPAPDEFTPTDPRKAWVKFRIGEELELNGEKFYIRKITKKDILIRPVK